MSIAALIVAAGKGVRAGGGLPKQFCPLAGKALILHSLDTVLAHPKIKHVVIVIGEGQCEIATQILAQRHVDQIVSGGSERQDSVLAGLMALEKLNCTHVLIHDAARPGLPPLVIDRLIDAMSTHDAATPAIKLADTIAFGDDLLGDNVPREQLVRVQTPQAFRMSAILKAHKNWAGGPATDDAQMARQSGIPVAIVEGDYLLEKVTHAEDFCRMEALLNTQLVSRTGIGYDVHRLDRGYDLWLGGVRIDHEMGLAGHSDADVALHAITDAILGALGEGDIGTHFPPSDSQWQGARSSKFVEFAGRRVQERGGIIDHIDITIICEAPKIGPHREEIKEKVAATLGISTDAISVKATTTEGLGFTGRKEGIATQAIATVRLPVERHEQGA